MMMIMRKHVTLIPVNKENEDMLKNVKKYGIKLNT